MWPRLKEQIAVEQAEIAELINYHRELLDKAQEASLAGIELSATAAFLHSLYSGIENFFRRVAVEIDGAMPRDESWHQTLLQSMAEATPARPRVISAELRDRLKPFLQFRHLFRNIYTFRMEWERMEPLVLSAEAVVGDLNQELASFVQAMDARHGSCETVQ